MKLCSKCKTRKRNGKTNAYCKPCMAEYMAHRYATRADYRAYNKKLSAKYYERNRARVTEVAGLWRKENRDYWNAYQREWRKNNREHARAYGRARYHKNKKKNLQQETNG
jgi:hypothetical protein